MRHIRDVFANWLGLKEVKKLKITAGVPEYGLNPHIMIIAIFEDSEKSVQLSEEFEYELLSGDLKASNRIIVYSLFK
ncbi:hypothetical protein A3L04_05375 [Thermococcus chitonophagus]|uniref:Uncharacterized protein n=1 Tax=Thermococcus chitonophagus TaxID=54262 RepID=A0A161KIN6_9EURY|nr:hypothetical protein [Thermococcus chitonophagus]ASJ16544.1 hypothetical protein A3L04_05375 [Thermococcus chitonophagus]CUX77548.1 hypothetical protein CHITON_0769 [Thermococcus chitonophagus]